MSENMPEGCNEVLAEMLVSRLQGELGQADNSIIVDGWECDAVRGYEG